MIDRGMIKWQPFNSCFSSNKIMSDLEKEREKIEMPILSDDQLKNIEEAIVNSYNLKINVNVKYFCGGNIFSEKGKIIYINVQEKKIYLNNKFIYFRQILNVSNY